VLCVVCVCAKCGVCCCVCDSVSVCDTQHLNHFLSVTFLASSECPSPLLLIASWLSAFVLFASFSSSPLVVLGPWQFVSIVSLICG
jgi:hypothetical protein